MRSSIFPPRAFLLRWIVHDGWMFDAFATQVEVEKFCVGKHGQVFLNAEVLVLLGRHVVWRRDRVQIRNVFRYTWCFATIEARHGCT